MVAQSFTAGGSGYSAPGYPKNTSLENYFELQNYTSLTWGAHTTKLEFAAGQRFLDDNSAKNFNGIYQFLGSTTLSSIQQYLMTVRLLNAGYTSAAVNAMGYGPSKYTVSSGNPRFSFQQTDLGPFIQDDWRVRPNLTLSLGVRFESQTDIPDKNDWAPRVGFAWSPGNSQKSKLVIRGGWGMFYDRFAAASVEQALRYSQGGNLSTETINSPTGYDATFSQQLEPGLGQPRPLHRSIR